MSLKSSFDSAVASNLEKRANFIQEITRQSDEQIAFAKDAIMKALSTGSSKLEIHIKPITSKSDEIIDMARLVNSRLERSIGNWLETEGFTNSVLWTSDFGKVPTLHVFIFPDECNTLRAQKPTVSVKDIATKFENCHT